MKRLKSNRLSHLANGQKFPTPKQAQSYAEFAHTIEPPVHDRWSGRYRCAVKDETGREVGAGYGDTRDEAKANAEAVVRTRAAAQVLHDEAKGRAKSPEISP